MHRSRLYAVLLDTPDADAATAFWSAALGAPPRPNATEPQFTALQEAAHDLVVAVQRLDGEADAPRCHLDIETDDLDAETARLTALGAVEVNRWQDCRVLRAPGGHLLCVLPVESDPDDFACRANVWE
jgi:predicted TPR repeat methyltransferase